MDHASQLWALNVLNAMSYGRMLVTASAGVLQSAPMVFPMTNTASTTAPVPELVSFTATENSRRFSVSSLLELEELTPAGAKRGLDTDRSEGTCTPLGLSFNEVPVSLV